MVNFSHNRFGNRSTRGIRFQAAPVATATDTPTSIDDYMPNLTRCTCQTRIQFAVLHNTRTNARSDKDTDKIVVALSCPTQIFSQRGHLNIVADGHRLAKLLTENITQSHILHPQIGSI